MYDDFPFQLLEIYLFEPFCFQSIGVTVLRFVVAYRVYFIEFTYGIYNKLLQPLQLQLNTCVSTTSTSTSISTSTCLKQS